ncbi:MAG: SDR family NAD(P)-dependent oxidoreductase [Planctomycetota bacterium]|jgi:3-oxoacyl-[acyl-carrier protein] reductase
MTDRRVALVTGASRGIGAATAEELARRNYHVALVARSDAGLAAIAERVRQTGSEALLCQGDLADLDFAESTVRRAVSQWHRLDVLVNNAAWRELASMRQIGLASWEKTLRVCLTAPAFLAKWAAEVMEPRGGGVIVNVSSIMSARAGGVSPAYVAAKGALDSLTYELATLYGPSGIRVVAVSPGAIDTEISRDLADGEGDDLAGRLRAWSCDHVPLGRWGTPKEVARLIAMLAGDDARYVTGTTVVVDGGWLHSHFPRSLQRRIRREESCQSKEPDE